MNARNPSLASAHSHRRRPRSIDGSVRPHSGATGGIYALTFKSPSDRVHPSRGESRDSGGVNWRRGWSAFTLRASARHLDALSELDSTLFAASRSDAAAGLKTASTATTERSEGVVQDQSTSALRATVDNLRWRSLDDAGLPTVASERSERVAKVGGEGGIASYRSHVAAVAMTAVIAVGHCPPLPGN
jgi:hypothetical protein